MTFQPCQCEDATLKPLSQYQRQERVNAEIYWMRRVIDRGLEMAEEYGRTDIAYERDAVTTYILGCHEFCVRLQLQQLAEAPNYEFAHDFFGILNEFDLGARRMKDCFMPRFAVREENAEGGGA